MVGIIQSDVGTSTSPLFISQDNDRVTVSAFGVEFRSRAAPQGGDLGPCSFHSNWAAADSACVVGVRPP